MCLSATRHTIYSVEWYCSMGIKNQLHTFRSGSLLHVVDPNLEKHFINVIHSFIHKWLKYRQCVWP